MIKNPISRQLINHAISVVLQRRYRRALKAVMPNGQHVENLTQKRETGRGRTRLGKKAYAKGTKKQKKSITKGNG